MRTIYDFSENLKALLLLVVVVFVFSWNKISAQYQYSYKERFVEGNYLLLEENYPRALENFLDAYKLDSTNANINYLVGICYLRSIIEKEQSVHYFQKAVTNVSEKYKSFEVREKRAPITAYYYLASAYHLTYQIDSAIAYFQKYKSFLNPIKQPDLVKDVNRQIEMCKNAKEYLALPTHVSITNLGDSVNSAYPDYSPVITADESMLIFTSRRPGSTGGELTADEQFFEDIYVCYKKEDGTWGSPVSIGENINTAGHEATIGLSADGYQLFIYKDDGNGDGNIYLSTLDGEIWTTPVKMGSDINTPAWEPSACLTPDGNTLYFVSDRKGGYGGRDIYRCVRLPNGEWSLATNLGPTINTEYDEDAPFIHPDRITLFFSSNGHSSMGGFDIFYTTKNDTAWTTPVNLLYPINTTGDDIFYASSTDGKRAYYSSVRPDSYGDKDIYMISLEDAPVVASVALIIGRIIPEQGKVLPKELEITVTNTETGEVGLYKANSKSGKYVLPLMPGKSYDAVYTIGGNVFFEETINVPLGSSYVEIEKEIYLDPIKLQGGAQSQEAKPTVKGEEPTVKEAQNITATVGEMTAKSQEKAQAVVYNKKVYKVQISSVKKPALYDAFKGIKNIEYRVTDNGWYVYYTGTFKSYKEGISLKDEMVAKGFSDAIIVPVEGELFPFDDTPPAKRKASNERNVNSASLTSVTATQFEMFFKYNIIEVDVNNNDYKTFIATLAKIIKDKGAVTLSIVSSASQVPTRSFGSNRELAASRAESSKTKIISSLKELGEDAGKVNFKKVSSSVNGPSYNDDYLINKSNYEKHQYVKITIE